MGFLLSLTKFKTPIPSVDFEIWHVLAPCNMAPCNSIWDYHKGQKFISSSSFN